MAHFAGDLDVQARQGVARLGMVKPRGCLPVREIVALRAIGAEPTLVGVFVTGDAVLGKAEPCPGQILDLDCPPLRGGNVAGRVAFVARDLGVLALQRISCLAVIEGIDGSIPVNQVEVLAVMFGVTFGAFLAVGGILYDGGVVAAVFPQPLGNLRVALHAFQFPSRHA